MTKVCIGITQLIKNPILSTTMAFCTGTGLFLMMAYLFGVKEPGVIFAAIKAGAAFSVVVLPPALAIWYYG